MLRELKTVLTIWEGGRSAYFNWQLLSFLVCKGAFYNNNILASPKPLMLLVSLYLRSHQLEGVPACITKKEKNLLVITEEHY